MQTRRQSVSHKVDALLAANMASTDIEAVVPEDDFNDLFDEVDLRACGIQLGCGGGMVRIGFKDE